MLGLIIMTLMRLILNDYSFNIIISKLKNYMSEPKDIQKEEP
jgi:hypothetical protein